MDNGGWRIVPAAVARHRPARLRVAAGCLTGFLGYLLVAAVLSVWCPQSRG